MNYQTWLPVYERILADFGYDRAGDGDGCAVDPRESGLVEVGHEAGESVTSLLVRQPVVTEVTEDPFVHRAPGPIVHQ